MKEEDDNDYEEKKALLKKILRFKPQDKSQKFCLGLDLKNLLGFKLQNILKILSRFKAKIFS